MAEQVITGNVTEVSAKDWNDRETGENITLYSFKVDSDNRWFRTGTTNPASSGIAQGQGVKFVVKGQNVDLKTVEPATVAAATPPPPRGSKGGGFRKGSGGGGARNDYWENKAVRDVKVVEPRITLASAQRDAITVVGLALQHDSIVFGNANKGARLDIILESIDRVAEKFYNDRMRFEEDA